MTGPIPMSNSANPTDFAESKAAMNKEIHTKWAKFTEAEVSAFKGKDDLVSRVSTKYSLDKAQAQKDVDGFLHGRKY